MRPRCFSAKGRSVTMLKSVTGLSAEPTFTARLQMPAFSGVTVLPVSVGAVATRTAAESTAPASVSGSTGCPGCWKETRSLPLSPRSGTSASSIALVRYAVLGALGSVSAAAIEAVAREMSPSAAARAIAIDHAQPEANSARTSPATTSKTRSARAPTPARCHRLAEGSGSRKAISAVWMMAWPAVRTASSTASSAPVTGRDASVTVLPAPVDPGGDAVELQWLPARSLDSSHPPSPPSGSSQRALRPPARPAGPGTVGGLRRPHHDHLRGDRPARRLLPARRLAARDRGAARVAARLRAQRLHDGGPLLRRRDRRRYRRLLHRPD